MTKKEFWERFKKAEIAVKTSTKKEFVSFIGLCVREGLIIGCTECEMIPKWNSKDTVVTYMNIAIYDPIISIGLGIALPIEQGCVISFDYVEEKSNIPVFIDFKTAKNIICRTELHAEIKHEIYITSDGTTTQAILKKDGKIVKKTEAKRCPTDKYDFKAGTRIVLHRLFNPKFKVGDRVRFKSWEQMEKEYGESQFGRIDVCEYAYFTSKMKHLCGTYATVVKFRDKQIILNDFTSNGNCDLDYYSEMLELVTKENPELYNRKVVATENYSGITKGKIYEVIDGKFKDDDGDMRPLGWTAKTLENLEIYHFIEVVE